jgi:exodeoxyribonuclease V gamma subunit
VDESIRFHIAHGPQREVEILHDQLLAAFNDDPTLRPRDVIVMVPDIEAYAPHIQAVFGLLERSDPRYIPFSVADRGQRAADPLVGALQTLLGLPQSRFTVSDLLDLLDALRHCRDRSAAAACVGARSEYTLGIARGAACEPRSAA